MATIMVDPSKLTSTATTVEGYAGDYKKTYEQLLNEVDAMSAAWSGTDNAAFTAQIKGFQERFQAMYSLMNEYAAFLRQSAADYNAAQQAITEASKKL